MTTGTVTIVLGAGLPAAVEALEFALARRPGLDVLGSDVSVKGTVDKVAISRPDGALICADLDEWDGVRACADIKRLGGHTRVLVAGSKGDDVTLLAAVKAGADGFVTVDDSVDEVAEALRRVCRGESHVPPSMLGGLLRGLIEFRREDDAAFERFASLGKRERQVLVELVAGLDYHAIAGKLHLSPHTVRAHSQSILTKLGVHSRLEAVRMVFEHDLLARFGIDPSLPTERGLER